MGWRSAVLAGCVVLAGCGAKTAAPKADGSAAASAPDAGSGTGAAPEQPGSAPAGDAGNADGGGGSTDLPPQPLPDAGTPDPGTPDAGTPAIDGGVTAIDAGTPVILDGGVAPGGASSQYLPLTPEQGSASEAFCLYNQGIYARYVLEAYVTEPGGVHTCWVAWIGDTGSSIVFNEGAAWDEAKVFVKEGGDTMAPVWHPLAQGGGQVGPNAGMNSFSLVIEPSSKLPMVATVREESVHWDGSDVSVSRWDGQAWQQTAFNGDTRLNATPHNPGFGGGSNVDSPRFSLDAAQHVVLTWRETTGSGWTTFQRTWDGTRWSEAVQVR